MLFRALFRWTACAPAVLGLSFVCFSACGAEVGHGPGQSAGAAGQAGSPGSEAGSSSGGDRVSSAGAAGLAEGGGAGMSETGGAAGASGAASAGAVSVSGTSIYVPWAEANQLSGDEFFDHPWPSDARLDENGFLDLSGFVNPNDSALLDNIVAELQGQVLGFSPVGAGYLRFSVALDEASLPEDPLASTSENSSLSLVDVDPDSEQFGQRLPLSWYFRRESGVYWPENTLSYMPALGVPLLPATRYAVVVTDRVRAADGGIIEAATALVDDLDSPKEPLALALVGLAAAGVDRDHIVHLATFKTSDPVESARVLHDFVLDEYPAPTDVSLSYSALDSIPGSYAAYLGSYGPSPDFQVGTPPFAFAGDGGELAFDPPEVQRELVLDFALTVPDSEACPEPAAGYPVVIAAHGTGGSRLSILGADREAGMFADRCLSTFAIDQIFHGNRVGGSSGLSELLFFNFQNPSAGRSNAVQGAVDLVQQARVVTSGALDISAQLSHAGEAIRFDPDSLTFFGHSQGGLNGPMFLAVDDSVRGGVLSGASGMMSIALLEKTEPVDVAALVRETVLGLSDDEADELNLFHPALSLAQNAVDPSDPVHYAPLIFSRVKSGAAPKSLLMTEGVTPEGTGDSYAPPHGIEVLAVAAGLPPQQPVIHPVAELAYAALSPVTIPDAGLSGNLAGGLASGVLAQWPAELASDGHFVAYEVPEASAQVAGFLSQLASEPVGRVPAP